MHDGECGGRVPSVLSIVDAVSSRTHRGREEDVASGGVAVKRLGSVWRPAQHRPANDHPGEGLRPGFLRSANG